MQLIRFNKKGGQILNYRKSRQDFQASITIYLSLVLLLILSLLMTIIEGARQTTARVFAERAFTTSMDSILAEFYGPLMEEYHVLGLDSAYGENTYNEGQIISKMEDYMSYTFLPKQGLSKSNKQLELYGISLDSVDIKSTTSFMDYQGELFIQEITEYMKYRELGNVAEFLLNKASLLEQPQKVSILYNEKLKLEEELVAIDEGMLALIKHIDGISTGKKGIKRNKDGSLKTNENFVKRIIYETPTKESAGINNDLVFLALENQYVDPSTYFTVIEDTFVKIAETEEIIKQLDNNLQAIDKEIEEANKSLKQLEETLSSLDKKDKDGIKATKKEIKDVKKDISDLEDEKKVINKEIKSYNKVIEDYIDIITSQAGKVRSLATECKNQSKKAISELEDIIKTAEKAEPMIISYEESLDKEKEGLNEDLIESLEENLKELKQYQLDNENGYDFLGMKEILIYDNEVIQSCISILDEGDKLIKEKNFVSAKDSYINADKKLKSYETSGLDIDYSSLVINNEETPDYIDGIKDLLEEGIISLVIDPDTISDKELLPDNLPSTLHTLLEGQEGFSFLSLLSNMSIGSKDSGMTGLFGSFDDTSIGSLIGDALNEIAESILIQEYIGEHFYRFPVLGENTKANKPSALTYEREYLLSGKMTDKDNLEAILIRIILIRTLLNFTTILTDKDKVKDAKSIASMLVGFTGLPIVVSITQCILMVLLALMSALVDTCALLMGKELPILKKKIDLNYLDILSISREKIKKEASSYKEDNGFSYNDYLTLFLYLTNKKDLTYRMMDLAEENINLRYGTKFAFENCLFAYEAEAKFSIKPLFTTFTFVQEYITGNINEPFIVNAEYSY